MRLPPEIRSEVEAALVDLLGARSVITKVEPVGGGCISATARVETAAGDVGFLKWDTGSDAPPGLFAAEAAGLTAIADVGAIRVPRVLALRDEGGGPRRGAGLAASSPDAREARANGSAPGGATARWILLEWLPPGRPTEASWSRLGAALANLHRAVGEGYGWIRDNFIGALSQSNAPTPDWAAFWRDQRLLPQLRLAYDAGYFDTEARRRFDALLDSLDDRLAGTESDGASPLHGDLWSGNVHFTSDAEPALIDPSFYFGHREVDLAMADLFGGFPPAFWHAYEEAWPLTGGDFARRRAIYQLYYLLVHVNLFGSGYVSRTLTTLRRT